MHIAKINSGDWLEPVVFKCVSFHYDTDSVELMWLLLRAPLIRSIRALQPESISGDVQPFVSWRASIPPQRHLKKSSYAHRLLCISNNSTYERQQTANTHTHAHTHTHTHFILTCSRSSLNTSVFSALEEKRREKRRLLGWRGNLLNCITCYRGNWATHTHTHTCTHTHYSINLITSFAEFLCT